MNTRKVQKLKKSTRTIKKRKVVHRIKRTRKVNKNSIVPEQHSSETSENVREWFKNVYDYLKKENNLDVLENGDRIFNMDEVDFPFNPRSPTSPVRTTLITINASGVIAPPLLLFPFKDNPPKHIVDNVPPSWGIGPSSKKKAADIFLDYIKNVFYPWLIEKKTQLPVIVIVDYIPSHLTLPLLKFCRANKIHLACIPPDGEQLIHPMEAIVLPLIKDIWFSHFLENDKFKITNVLFPQMLKRLFEALTVDQLKDGFRKCGLYPFNSEAYKGTLNNSGLETTEPGTQVIKHGIELTRPGIELTRPRIEVTRPGIELTRPGIELNRPGIEVTKPGTQVRQTTQIAVPNRQAQLFRLQFEKLLGPLLHEFKKSGNTWKGAVENKSLFELWLNLPKVILLHNTNKCDHLGSL